MNKLGILIAPAVFIYLIFSFLIASFDITLWSSGQRFIAVVIYLFILGGFNQSSNKSDKDRKIEESKEQKLEEKVETE